MKKSIKTILIVLILNIIFITSVYAITPSEIISMTDEQINSLSDEEIANYIQEIESLKGKEDPDKLHQAYNKLSVERARRKNGDGDYKDYVPNGTIGSTKVQTMAGNILAIVRNIGIAVSIIALSVIGIKYMLGSVEQRAEYKKSLIPFVIGVIMLAAGTTVVSFINGAINGDGSVSNYQKGYNEASSYVAGNPPSREILSMIQTKQIEYDNTTDENKKEYLKGYIDALNSGI